MTDNASPLVRQGTEKKIMSRLCLGLVLTDVSVMSRSCLGLVLVLSLSFLGDVLIDISVMSRSCLSLVHIFFRDVSVLFWCCFVSNFGGVLKIFQ